MKKLSCNCARFKGTCTCMSYFLEASTFLLSSLSALIAVLTEVICTSISHGFREVDRQAVHEVCPHVHLGRNNEAQDRAEMKLKESHVLQWRHLCALNYLLPRIFQNYTTTPKRFLSETPYQLTGNHTQNDVKINRRTVVKG